MKNTITFFDVETPNGTNSKICSIGVIQTDLKGNVLYKKGFLVKPEQGFDIANIKIHGITQIHVRNCPTFKELWETELAERFTDSLLVAHNASFDLNVLDKTLTSYDISMPEFFYTCTYESSKHLMSNLENYQLPTVCAHYGYTLSKHHDAIADADACRAIYWGIAKDFGETALRVKLFIPSSSSHISYVAPMRSRLLTDLYSTVVGISWDDVIAPEENIALENWLTSCECYLDDNFINATCKLVKDVLSDGVVDQEERDKILNLTRPFVWDGHNCEETVLLQELLGIVKGITSDGKINEAEAINLRDWLDELSDCPATSVFASLKNELHLVLEDGVISRGEEAKLLKMFDDVLQPVKASNESINYEGKSFCLTGNFKYGSKPDVSEIIISRGGIMSENVSGKIAYLAVGELGSEQYANGNYGTKIIKAKELQSKGKPIRVITESELGL